MSANEQSLPQFNTPIDISAGYTDTTKGTDYASLVRAAAKKHKLPDDVADDYLQVTGKIESGNQHYDKSGKVKESYAGALGGGQLTPDKPGGRTKRVVDQVYDLSDPAQNAEAGVRYFNSFGDDPVARRIGYFGGDGPALKHYRQTGRIPAGGDRYTTFQQYVDRTMGSKHKAVPDISAGFGTQDLPTFNAPDAPDAQSSDSSGRSRPTTVAPPVSTSSPLIEPPVAAANGQTSQLPTFTRPRSVVAQDEERLNRGDDFAPAPSGYAAEQAKSSAIDQWSNRELAQQQAVEHATGVRRRAAQQQIAKRNAMVENLRVSMLTQAMGAAAHAEPELRDKILDDVKNASTADVMKWARGTGTKPAGSFKFVGAENKDGSFSFHPQTIADRLSQPAPKNANDIEAQTKDSIRAQILSERAAAEKGSVEGQEFAMARGASEPANAVETEVNRRYQSQQQASQERVRLFQALTPAEKDQWTNGLGKQASDILQSPLHGVASAVKEFRAKATRLSAGIVDLVSKIPGDTVTERRIADDLRLRAQQLEDATQVAESNAPLNFKQQALKQVYGLVGGLVLNSPAMLNPVAGFAAMNVLEASGENKPWSERLRRGIQGAAIGGVFEGAGLIPAEGTTGVDQLRQIATQSAAIGAGTFGVETAFGAHPVDALKSAAINMGLHGIFKAPELLSAGADVGMRSESLPENVRSALARTQGREPIIAQRQGSDEYASVFVDPEVAKQESALNRKAQALAREGDEAGLAEVRSQLDKLRNQHIVTPLTPDEAADRMRGIDEGNRRAVSMPASDYDRMMERAGKKPLPQREVSATPAAKQGLLASGEEPAAPPTSPLQPRAPEAPEAVEAQVDALVEGRGGRKAVILPKGTLTPGQYVPDGYALYGFRGQSVIYDPGKVSKSEIQDAINNKRTSDLTGAVEQEGPGTTAVVTARKEGKEQETVYVSPEKVDQQVAETQAQHPDAEIEVGGRTQVEKVIADRQASDYEQRYAAARDRLQSGESKPKVEITSTPEGVSSRRAVEKEVKGGKKQFIGYAWSNEGGRLSVDATGDTAAEAQQNAIAEWRQQMQKRSQTKSGKIDLEDAETEDEEKTDHDFSSTQVQITGKAADLMREAQAAQGRKEKPDYGTLDRPNVPTLSEAFRDHFNKGEGFKSIVEARKFAGDLLGGKIELGTKAVKAIDEAVELGAVRAAREIVVKDKSVQSKFNELIGLNEQMPNLGTKTSSSVKNQAYSTPLPLAFVASRLAGIDKDTSVYEPTAGNGALLIGANTSSETYANEFDPARGENLRSLGFSTTSANATDFDLGRKVDVIIANPPFGVVIEGGESKKFKVNDQYTTTEIDHAIAIKALEAMKDDGNAVLIVGGINATDTEARAKGYQGIAKRRFYSTLYDGYNVVDHFTVNGDLYKKQGAAWPVDVIVIRGRGKSARALPAADVPRIINTWDELGGILDESPGKLLDADKSSIAEGRRDQGDAGADAGQGSLFQSPERQDKRDDLEPAGVERVRPDGGRSGNRQVDEHGSTGSAAADLAGKRSASGEDLQGNRPGELGVGADGTPSKPRPVTREALGATQSPYRPSSGATGLSTLVPVNMEASIKNSLNDVVARRGNVDQFIGKELGYDPDTIGKHFSAEQVDALALALDNMMRGSGFIIGDQGGIGKGRVVAGVIRWALRNGKIPIFVTEKPNLYKDIVRDLVDIGEGKIADWARRALMTNSGEKVYLDDNQEIPLRSGDSASHKKKLQDHINDDSLGQHEVIFTTYNQMQTVKGVRTIRQDFLQHFGDGAVMIFDESHNAGGAEKKQKPGEQILDRALFARQLIQGASAVFYSSATYAKRPQVMDLYSKTDMAKAVDDPSKLAEAIAKGGVPLQQVVAAMLAEAGQYMRRERDFAGMSYETQEIPVDHEMAESTSAVMRSIAAFDQVKQAIVSKLDKAARKEAKAIAGESGATGNAGATSTNFTSLMHNLVGQMLLMLKADGTVKKALEVLSVGEKPVITLSNTMGSFIKNYVEDFGLNPGDALNLSFGDMLRRYLERSRDVVVGKAFGPKERHHLTDAELGEAGIRSYKQALDLIHNTDWTSLPVSPIDYIKNALLKKGYKTGEITGRQHVIDYSSGQVYRTRPGKEISIAGRSKTLVDFNFGRLDGLIINQAGSTGLSIHASERFRDQKKRHMLIAQPELNIDTHMQMLYRVDRTGQVVKPSYSQLTADIPAEKRPAAILSKKMASLNANTTAAKGSAYEAKNVPDFMNDYGDDIVASILEDDPELHAKLGSPPALKPNQKGNGLEREGAIRKVTGRIALLPLTEQEAFYQRIESEYDDLISRLDAMGENALEAKTLNLDAKSLSRRPVFPSKGPSPFEQPAYAEVMDVKKIGKPYTTDQVMTQLRGALQFTETATIHQVEVAGEQRADLLLKDQNAKFDDYLHSIVDEIEDVDRARAKEAQLQGAIDRWRTLVQDFPVGRSVQLYTPAGQVYGIVTKVERKGKPKNPIALGTWRITFAVADAMRTVTMPMSKINVPGLADEDAVNEYFVRGYRVEQAQMATVHDRAQKKVVTVPVIEAFDRGQTESREDRTIMTGNILAAFGKFSKGRIINFTDEHGTVRQGIMMPSDFNLESELEAKAVKFADAHQVQQFLETDPNKRIVENDQKTLQLNWTSNGMLRVSTASSKAVGGQFYLNEQILNAAGDREFVKSGQRMQLTVYARNAAAVIHAIIGEGIHLQTDTHKKEARQVTGEADPGLFSVKREGQAGAVPIGAIFGPVINKLFPHLQEPAKQFSFIDSFSTRFIRGGSQMKRMGEDVYKQFAKAAGSRSSAAVINITAKTQIIKAFKGNDKKYEEFLAAGEESRLRGVRERWDDLSQDMQTLPNTDVKNAYEKGLRNVVQRIADHPIFDAEKDVLGSLIDYTDSMLATAQFGPLKDFMSMMFEQARDNVATIDWNGDPDWFDDFTVTPEFQDALGVYKRLVEKPVSESHQENDGIFSTALGPLNTYFPLVPVQKDGSMLRRTATGAYKPYKRPENVHNRMATGLSERYDLTAGNLAETISKALAINNKATLLKALEDEGLLIPLRKNQAWNKTLAYKGVEYKADLVAVKDPRTLYKDGKVINIPGKMAVIPSFIRREIKPILEGDFTDGDGNALIKAINMIGMVGPLDAAFHSANVIGAVVAGTPFAGTDILSKTVGNTPATKLIASLINILRTDPLDEQGLKDLHEMSKLGVLPDRYASVTFSRAFARQIGAKWRPVSFSPLLFGPAGLDVRARLLMFRIAQSIDPVASTNDKVEFLGQLGIYNKAMQSEVERFLKKWGISPFYTAGSTMLRNGVRIWTGGSKIPDAGKSAGTRAAYRLAQQLSAGALGLIALWIVTHKLYTGKYPWQDPDSRFLQIKLKKEHRNSRLGKAMFGHNDKPGYVGLGFLSPMVDRGATALGITGAYETTMAGGSPGQIYERGERDIANSLLHPIVSGPAARGAFVMATGSEPYLSQTRDPYGQFGPHLLPAIGKTKPGLPTVYARVREGMLSWSSFNQKFSAELFGIGHVAEENEKQDKGGLYLRMMMDLAVPRLIKGTYNRDATAKRLEKERKTEDPNIVNQLRAKDVKGAADFYRHASDEDKARLLQPMLRKVQIARPGAIDEDTRTALKEAGLDNALQTSEKRRPVEKELQDLGLKFPQVERRIQVGANSKYLSDDEYDHYQQRANDLFYDRIPKAIASDDYKSAERAERASIIKKVESNARALATAEMRAQLAPKDVKIRGELMREQVRDRVLGTNVKLMRLRDQSREKKLEVQHPNSP